MEVKWKSRLTSLIGGIITMLSFVTAETLHKIIPPEYAYTIPIIIGCITIVTTIYTEETRVEHVKTIYSSDEDEEGI